MKKFKETGDLRYIYQIESDKTCFQHDFKDFKDLYRTTIADKVLRTKACNVAKNPKYDGYQRGFASMAYRFFDKKAASLVDKSTSGRTVKNETISNKE